MKVTHHDNRGTKEVPFGFVYFDDDARVGYAPGVQRGRDVFPYEGPYWKTATPTHVRVAIEYLAKQGIEVGKDWLPIQ